MTKSDKIIAAIVIILLASVLGFLIKVESPSPSLGSGSLYVPAYIDYYTSSASTTLATFPGVLHTIVIGKAAAGSVITVYDSSSSSVLTTILTSITIPNATTTPFYVELDSNTANGLTVTQSGATSTLTLTYQQQ